MNCIDNAPKDSVPLYENDRNKYKDALETRYDKNTAKDIINYYANAPDVKIKGSTIKSCKGTVKISDEIFRK